MLIRYITTHRNVKITIVSESMSPVIISGDVVFIDRPKRILWPGELLFCHRNNAFYVHRLIFCWRGKWYLKGDNAHSFDSPIRKKYIIGQVTRIQDVHGREKHDYAKTLAVIRAFTRLIRARLKV